MSKNAFATIHFGSNPVYLELELYFFRMLRKYTKHDILYLYSVNDTPPSFVEAVRPLVDSVIPYDDKGITYDVKFESGYSNFNTLRTCNFIFAYTLEKYEKVCIIESDMVIMGNLDSVFKLNSPAVLTYHIGEKWLRENIKVVNKPADAIKNCNEMGRTNGGVMLIEPSLRLFETYKDKIKDVVKQTCKYPNETLFEYVNNSYFNMPIQYNLSHFLAKPHIIAKYGLSKEDILVFHFNETKFKHIDIIKNPVDESGINWLENPDPKYAIKRNAVLHYKNTVYDKHPEISKIISKLSEKKSVDIVRMDDRLKGREYIQQSIAIAEEKDEDFGALLKQMKVYQPAFDKLPKPTQDKLHQMELKDMVKEMKKIIDKKEKEEKEEKERVLKWNREMDQKEKEEKERVLKWNRDMDKKEKEEKEKEEKKRVLKWNRDMDKKEKEEKEKEEKKRVLKWNREMDQKEKEEKEKEKEETLFLPHTPPFPPPPLPQVYLQEPEPSFIKAKSCKDGEELNPETGRCRKKCPPGTARNEKGKCVKSANKTKKTKACKDGEEINPETGRCRKVCPPDKIRNEKGVCVNKKK